MASSARWVTSAMSAASSASRSASARLFHSAAASRARSLGGSVSSSERCAFFTKSGEHVADGLLRRESGLAKRDVERLLELERERHGVHGIPAADLTERKI